jgi:amidase
MHYLSAAELAAEIVQGRISPVEATRHELARIERLDGELRSYLTVTPESALAEARAAEQDVVRGRVRGPLHGVPVAVKDLCDTAGVRTTAGTRVMRDRVPAEDAAVVARLRRAGAVVLGKLNMTEGAYAENHPDYPPPVNPWNADAWTGVSSSGSGVATAAGLCFASLGSDTGGSIRFPSAMNGLVGIKPTWGRVPVSGVFPMAWSLDHVGPMCRTVLDAAIVLGVIAGRDDADPTSAPEPLEDYAGAATAQRIDGLRIGVDRRYSSAGLDPEIAGYFDAAIAKLAALGARIVDVDLAFFDELGGGWSMTCAAEMLAVHAGMFPERAPDYGPALTMLLEMARTMPAVEYARAHQARLVFCGRLAALLDDIDAIACPTVGVRIPARISMLDPEAAPLMLAAMRFTAPFNSSGSPTVSLPCGACSDGVPASLQLVGRHFEEATIIAAAAAYEAATDWHLRRPPLPD